MHKTYLQYYVAKEAGALSSIIRNTVRNGAFTTSRGVSLNARQIKNMPYAQKRQLMRDARNNYRTVADNMSGPNASAFKQPLAQAAQQTYGRLDALKHARTNYNIAKSNLKDNFSTSSWNALKNNYNTLKMVENLPRFQFNPNQYRPNYKGMVANAAFMAPIAGFSVYGQLNHQYPVAYYNRGKV